MISSSLKTQLTAFALKYEKEQEAYDLAVGKYVISNDGTIIPPSTSSAEVDRRAKMVASFGPKILNRKLDGIVGSVDITGRGETVEESRQDSRLKAVKTHLDMEYDLKDLIEKVSRDLVVKGSAGVAVGVDEEGEAYLYRLGGFLARLNNPTDKDRIDGILQLEPVEGQKGENRNRWDIHIFQGPVVQVWMGVKHDFSDFNADRPHQVYENDVPEVAFYTEYQSDQDNQAIGEMEQVAPILKNLLAIDITLHTIREKLGFSRPVVKGQILHPTPKERQSIGDILWLSTDGSIEYLDPADTTRIEQQKDDYMTALGEIATLPSGFLGVGNQPSGTAFKEANSSFNNSLDRYTFNISRLLTNGFWALFKVRGIEFDDIKVTLLPNRVVDKEAEVRLHVELLEKGLLTVSYVVSLLQKYYPGITDGMAAEIIQNFQNLNQVVTPTDLFAEI